MQTFTLNSQYMLTILKGQSILSRQFKMHFFPELCHFFDLGFFDIFNISFIAEDIELKLGLCVHYPKINPCYQGRQFEIHFFQNYAPFST